MKRINLLSTKDKLWTVTAALSILVMGAAHILSYHNVYLTATLVLIALVSMALVIGSLTGKLTLFRSLSAYMDHGNSEEMDRKMKSAEGHVGDLYHKIQEIISFIQSLGNGGFEFRHIDSSGKVGRMLNVALEKQQSYQEEERNRAWQNEGFSKFSEILRTSGHDLDQVSLEVIGSLVKHTGANQGAFFVEQEEGGRYFMELTASYAYDKNLTAVSRVEKGQGLLGQVMIRKETLLLTNLPTDFVNIVSGLGEAPPRQVIIVPLILDGDFHGALELASFKAFEPHEIVFLEEIAKNIASKVAATKASAHTRKLLSQSQEMSKELALREKKMRRNMEELQSAQDEMIEWQVELDGLFRALNGSQGLMEFSMEGKVLNANESLQRMTEYSLEELKKKPGLFLPEKGKEGLWEQLKKGESVERELNIHTRPGKEVWVNAHYSPVIDNLGKLKKILLLALNITETKEKSLNYQNQLKAIRRSSAVVELDPYGRITEVNNNFLRIFKYRKEEVVGKHHDLFVPPEDRELREYRGFWERLGRGEIINSEFKRVDGHGGERWVKAIYNPIFDLKGHLLKIIKFSTDITKERHLQLETENQQKELRSHLETIDKTIASLEFDIEGKISYVNQVYLNVSGYAKEELIGKDYTFLLTEEEINKPQTEMMWLSLREGNYFTGEFNQKSKSGKSMKLSGTFNPIQGSDGNPAKVMMFAQFNTQEKEKQEELIQTVNALKGTIALMELNVDGTFKKANKTFFADFGYKRAELHSKPLTYLFDEAMPESKMSSCLEKLARNEHFEERLFLLTQAQESKLFKASFTPIRDMDNEVVKTLVTLIDAAPLSSSH